jgi:23S rRNA (cytidine1920-2'-O)/16S rRNA (cytidine1409-2'-O)-methyltransferase
MRADVYLAKNGFCESRSRAAASIEAGAVFVNGKVVTKAASEITEGDTVEVRSEVLPYVSRGGFKLAGALEAFSLNVTGAVCADIGASTGGFTDCLLKNGAKKVYAIENGIGQLHPSLLNDSRVVSIEKYNARNLTADTLGQLCDIAVMDVSFISQTLLHRGVTEILNNGGLFISLIKPQFEVGKMRLGKGGVVKDPGARADAIVTVVNSAQANALILKNIAVSPITGGDGNREYLALFEKNGANALILTRELLKSLSK